MSIIGAGARGGVTTAALISSLLRRVRPHRTWSFATSGYSDLALDELIERSAVVLDPLKRRELLQRCMRMLTRDLPNVPLFVPFDLYGLRDGVEWRPRLDATVLAAEVRRR